MKTGILGFQSERLKQLRSASGLTQEKLAEIIGCNSGNISKWENGNAYPTVPSFQKICEVFGVSERWLLEPPIKSSLNKPSFFRSQVSTPKIACDVAEARLDWIEEISYKLQEGLEFPAVVVPCHTNTDPLTISDEEIENLADECRKLWDLGSGPIQNVLHTLENFGIVTARSNLGYLKMDGVSRWSEIDERPYILIAGDKASPIRNRFDAAHELGHIILHKVVSPEQFKIHNDVLESQAHRFASAFLMPSESYALEIKWPTLDGLLALKKRWKVSIAAMIKRCQDLEIVNDEIAIRLWKGRSARGWVKKEPLDDEFEFEKSRLLMRSVQMLVENKILSKERLKDNLGIPINKLEELCGLESGYFSSEHEAKIIDIRLKAAYKTSSTIDLKQGGVILDFSKP